MKTPKQVEVVQLAKAHLQSEIQRLDSLAELLIKIMNGYEPLLGDAGPGNTHGDNMQIRAYATFVAGQMSVILYNTGMTTNQIQDKRNYLYETYFKNVDFKQWRDVVRNIV
jgi:hypothetical protein